jgi:hypothetical protein
MSDNLPDRYGAVERSGQPTPTGALLAIRQALALLEDEAKDIALAGDYETLARGYAELTLLKRDLTSVLTIISDLIVDTVPVQVNEKGREYRDPFSIEGVGTFEVVRRAATRRWDSEELVGRIVRGAIVDAETGEVPDQDTLSAIRRVVDALTAAAPFTPSMGWRTTALKELGIDIDDYCETKRPEGHSLKLTGGEK